MDKFNYTMLCDFYELTMGNGYFVSGMQEKISYFDLFFRQIPDGGGFAIACGLEQVINYIENLHFDEEDIEFLRSKGIFDEGFLEYLKDFRFTGDIFAVPEGTVVFPNEPIITVRAPAVQAQLVETYLLLCINHQTLIATKANRIVRAAQGRAVSEFGSRRAHGADAAILGARASGIGGCSGTACTITDQLFGFNATGTMAHSWVQMFDSELEAFKTYCKCYPKGTVLLVDTYNVLKSGVPNAIKAFDEVLKPMGCRPVGIRIDSGDITYLSKKARKMLDEAGYSDCKICASNALDDDGNIQPKIKISENVAKITTPHFKKLYRIYDKNNHKAVADLLCVHDEVIDESRPLTLFDPQFTWKKKVVTNFEAKPIQQQIFKDGKCVYKKPAYEDIVKYAAAEIDTLWDEITRFENPHTYYVDLSQKLWNVKNYLLAENSRQTAD